MSGPSEIAGKVVGKPSFVRRRGVEGGHGEPGAVQHRGAESSPGPSGGPSPRLRTAIRVPAEAGVPRAGLDPPGRLPRRDEGPVGERSVAARPHGQEPQGVQGGPRRAPERRPARRHRAGPAGASDDVHADPAPDDQHDGRGEPRAATPFAATWRRRYSDRQTEWASHPMASRDSLHEADMWAVEGLTHRYPTKVLAELIPTCPQYCGHCTRMDLVGNDTAADPEVQVRDQAERALGHDARLPAQDARRSATWSSPAATWRTCRSSGSRTSS